MGTPLPPNEPGLDCLVCWGIGKTFGIGNTPKYIRVHLLDLLPGEFASEIDIQTLLTPHFLTQTLAACQWTIRLDGFTWTLSLSAFQSVLIVLNTATDHRIFQARPATLCTLDFVNEQTVPAGFITYGGTAQITWDLGGL